MQNTFQKEFMVANALRFLHLVFIFFVLFFCYFFILNFISSGHLEESLFGSRTQQAGSKGIACLSFGFSFDFFVLLLLLLHRNLLFSILFSFFYASHKEISAQFKIERLIREAFPHAYSSPSSFPFPFPSSCSCSCSTPTCC